MFQKISTTMPLKFMRFARRVPRCVPSIGRTTARYQCSKPFEKFVTKPTDWTVHATSRPVTSRVMHS